LLAGLAGIILSSRTLSGNANDGVGFELTAITAVVIGGTSLAGGVGGIPGTVIGILIIGVISNGLDILRIPLEYHTVINGFIILIAVIIDRINAKKSYENSRL
jgi:ribose transport system permease protein